MKETERKELDRLTAVNKRFADKPNDPVDRFIHTIDRLEERFKGYKYATAWLMDAELLKAARDILKQGKLF